MNMNQKGFANIILIVVIVILVGAVGYFAFVKKSEPVAQQPTPSVTTQTPTSQQPSPTPVSETANWKTYRSETFEFKYPEKLQLVKNGSKVILSHSISYENSGDCDMSGGGQLYKTLDDFNISFEIVNQKLTLNYIDGQYSAGTLKGSWAYEGAEGCGYSKYHFSIGENKTLVVQRAAVQALSGLSTTWDLEKILKVPGVISKQESDKLFNEILSTFKFIK